MYTRKTTSTFIHIYSRRLYISLSL